MARGAGAVVVGVGDAAFHDRAVGPEAVRRLQRCGLVGVRHIAAAGWGELPLDQMRGVDRLVLITAVPIGSSPGRLHTTILDPPRPAAPLGAGSVLDPFVQLSTLTGFPRRLVVYTVEAADLSAGPGLTAVVEQALNRLVGLVAREVAAETLRPTSGGSGDDH